VNDSRKNLTFESAYAYYQKVYRYIKERDGDGSSSCVTLDLLWQFFTRMLSLSVPLGVLAYATIPRKDTPPHSNILLHSDIDLNASVHWRAQAAFESIADWVKINAPEFEEKSKEGLH